MICLDHILMYSTARFLNMHTIYLHTVTHERGYAAAYLVEALCYKPEGQGSIPDKVTGIFNLPNPSSRTMFLGSTHPLTEMSTRNLPVG
jgi:hypothetical protein